MKTRSIYSMFGGIIVSIILFVSVAAAGDNVIWVEDKKSSFFAADDQTHGEPLWKSYGTESSKMEQKNQLSIREILSGSWKGLYGTNFSKKVHYGLGGFYFNFKKKDHEIKRFMAKIEYFLGTFYALWLDFSDKNSDDEYSWKITGQQLLHAEWASSFSTTAPKGGCIDGPIYEYNGQPDPPIEPVIIGFNFSFSAGDHHINAISVRFHWKWQGNTKRLFLKACFQDKNADDAYRAEIICAAIPKSIIKNVWSINGEGKKKIEKHIPSVNPVFQAFDLRFKSGDHHLDQAGVLLSTNKQEIWFQDKKPDDTFKYMVTGVDVQ